MAWRHIIIEDASRVHSGGYAITWERLNKNSCFNRGDTLCINHSVDSCSNPGISFHMCQKLHLLFSELNASLKDKVFSKSFAYAAEFNLAVSFNIYIYVYNKNKYLYICVFQLVYSIPLVTNDCIVKLSVILQL